MGFILYKRNVIQVAKRQVVLEKQEEYISFRLGSCAVHHMYHSHLMNIPYIQCEYKGHGRSVMIHAIGEVFQNEISKTRNEDKEFCEICARVQLQNKHDVKESSP